MGRSVRVVTQLSALTAKKDFFLMEINVMIAKVLLSTVFPVKKITVASVKQEGVLFKVNA